MSFRKMNVTVTMTGEEWFSILAHLAKRGLSPKGEALRRSGLDKMQKQVVAASEANPEKVDAD